MDILKQNKSLFFWEGIVFSAIGMLAIALPQVFTFTLEQVIGWLLVFSSLVQGYRAFQSRPLSGWGIVLFSAILGLVIGGLMIGYPIAGVFSLTFLVIAFFFVEGISKAYFAYQFKGISGWFWVFLGAIFSILLAICLLLGLPETALWSIGLLFGINMLFAGVSLLTFSYMLK